LLSASLLVGSVATGVLAAPSPAGAAGTTDWHPDHLVIVHSNYYESAWGGTPGQETPVHARPRETVEFQLADEGDLQHSITLPSGTCDGHADSLCEQRFDDPNVQIDPNNGKRMVVFRFFQELDFPFYDRFAPAAAPMTGRFIIKDADPPPPTTTTTTAPVETTTTTRPATTTTTAHPTTTTAPAPIRPQMVNDPPATTTTTAKPAAAGNTPVAPAPAPAPNKDKDKGKANDKKVKAAGTETAGTAVPAPSVLPTDVIFDAAMLTPGPTTVPDSAGGDTGDTSEAAIDAAPVVGLLDHVDAPRGDDGAHLMLLALGALTCLLLGCGIFGWYNRASRYDPA
jgi:hypothetical protein